MDRPNYWKTSLNEVEEILKTIKKGKVKNVGKSAGGRDLFLVEYGEKQDFNRQANYSSACGAGDPKFYADKSGKRPVIFIIGAEHGNEMEGIAAILNLIQMIETGKDFSGYSNPLLSECIKDCRLLLMPVANPDGRARMPIDTMLGENEESFRHYAQGRWKDGTLCKWPGCKQVHPIKDYVSHLGSYFNDDGINIIHDNFFGDMAPETRAIFDIADEEAPDYTLHLHGGANTINEIFHPEFISLYVKELIQELILRVKTEADKHKLPFLVKDIREDISYPSKSFSLYSALNHMCGTTSIVYESNQGLDYSDYRPLDTSWECVLSYEEIMTHHYILFEQTVKLALDKSGVSV